MNEPTGFAGFLCEVTQEPTAVSACLACAAKGALPGCNIGSPAIIAGIARHIRPQGFALDEARKATGLPIDLAFTVTELLGCARKARLMQTEAWFEKPSHLYWAYRGTLFHGEAEVYAESNPLAVSELRLFAYYRSGGKLVAVSGQPDLLLFDPEAGGWRLVDYKTTKEVPGRKYRYTCPEAERVIYTVPFRIKGGVNCPYCDAKHPVEDVPVEELPPGPNDHHVAQVQLYVSLIEKNGAKLAAAVNNRLGEQLVPTNAPFISAELMYLDMGTQRRFDVPFWGQPERAALLRQHLAAHLLADLPDILRDPETVWQCGFCPVAATCSYYHGGPIGKEGLAQNTQRELQVA